MNVRECRFCGCTLHHRPGQGWSGDHAPFCTVRRNAAPARPPAPDNTFDPEQIIGPVGQPTWAVTYSLHRLGTEAAGVQYTETAHTRAATMDGAILLTRELVPERIIDVEAYVITRGKEPA